MTFMDTLRECLFHQETAIHIVVEAGPSRSYFGGSPRLPSAMAWPTKNGSRLPFLARLSLRELHHAQPIAWLPEQGALLFFYDFAEQPWGYDPAHRGSFATLLVPDLDHALRPDEPDPAEGVFSLSRKQVRFTRVDAGRGEAVFGGKPLHQVAGPPAAVQGDAMELQCQLASNGVYCGDDRTYTDPRAAALAPGAANWRLLLQFDSDADVGVTFGDCGRLYYWVEKQRARVGDFSDAWVVLQGS